MKSYILMSYLILFLAAVFACWIIRYQDDSEILFNAAVAFICACGFIIICLGIFELCGCVM